MSINADLITVEAHGHYRKQLTTTSYMSHSVKKCVYVLGGGGSPGSFSHIYQCMVQGSNLIRTLKFKSHISILEGSGGCCARTIFSPSYPFAYINLHVTCGSTPIRMFVRLMKCWRTQWKWQGNDDKTIIPPPPPRVHSYGEYNY